MLLPFKTDLFNQASHMQRIIKPVGRILQCVCLLCLISWGAVFSGDGYAEVTCSDGLMSINSKEMRPEDIMKEIGDKCGIKVVLFGEVFSEIPVSVKFDQMPVKQAIKRVLRVADVTNYLIHMDETDNGSRIVEVDLIGSKGGERQLTDGPGPRAIPAVPEPVVSKKKKPVPRPTKQSQLPPDMSKEDMEKLQESFLGIMDEVIQEQFLTGGQPDPKEVIRMFKESVPPDLKDKMPPEVLEQLENME